MSTLAPIFIVIVAIAGGGIAAMRALTSSRPGQSEPLPVPAGGKPGEWATRSAGSSGRLVARSVAQRTPTHNGERHHE